jgi:HEPN domain
VTQTKQPKHDVTQQFEGLLSDAGARINQAGQLREIGRHAAAVQDSQYAIELLAKCVFLVQGRPYPKKEHVVPEDEFLTAIRGLPEGAKHLNVGRLYLLHKFWFGFRETARYGLETLAIPPEAVFQSKESELALAHAKECQGLIFQLRSIIQANAA